MSSVGPSTLRVPPVVIFDVPRCGQRRRERQSATSPTAELELLTDQHGHLSVELVASHRRIPKRPSGVLELIGDLGPSSPAEVPPLIRRADYLVPAGT